MISNLNGLVVSKGTSTDEVVRTIQALISAGYKGEELLEKIDEIYGVGARNNLLKVLDYEVPTSKTSINISYPEIFPSEKLKVGDVLIGSNGWIGQIIDIEFDQQGTVSSVTILGLGVSTVPKENSFEIQNILYEDLVNLKNNNQLVPGKQYRIVDYVATAYSEVDVPEYIVEEHPFDIIVIADSINTLNENARACLHDGDEYYSINNADLSKWELKYSSSNDRDRFDWADEENGKGVVYYLKDDNNNECPYDFKEIKFLRHEIISSKNPGDRWSNYAENAIYVADDYSLDDYVNLSDNDLYFFTFSDLNYNNNTGTYTILDSSLIKPVRVRNNEIKDYRGSVTLNSNTLVLPNIVFINHCRDNIFGYNCRNCTFNSDTSNNVINNDFHNNTIVYSFVNNTVDNGVCYCFIGGAFSSS